MKKLIMLVASLSLALTILVNSLLPIDYNKATLYAPLTCVNAYAISEAEAVEVDGTSIFIENGLKFKEGFSYRVCFKNDTMISVEKIKKVGKI